MEGEVCSSRNKLTTSLEINSYRIDTYILDDDPWASKRGTWAWKLSQYTEILSMRRIISVLFIILVLVRYMRISEASNYDTAIGVDCFGVHE